MKSSVKKGDSVSRIQVLDTLRATAMVLMIIFHFSFDLRYFGWVTWDVPNGDGWWQFRYVILTLFISTLGMSLSLAHGKGVRWRPYWVRCGQIGLAAAAVTAMSLVMFPKSWIFFGILQFMLFAALCSIWLVRVPILSFGLGLVILMSYWTGLSDSIWPFQLIRDYLPANTEDYVPVFPWLGVAFLGVFLGSIMPWRFLDARLPHGPAWYRFMGRHGLTVYLLHQPIMFAVLYPIWALL